MPWKETSIMDERREFVFFASQKDANVSALCRQYSISRQTGYKWLRRGGSPSEDFRDRSRMPLKHPMRTPAAMEAAVLAVRDAHPAWGARKIARCLHRDGLTPPADSTVHAILARHDRIGPEARSQQSYGCFEKSAPNQLWQMDFKGRVRMHDPDWCHPLTVLDDHSRFSPVLEACGDERTTTVKPLLTKALRRYGLPDAIYVDNGSPWGTGVPGGWTPLGVWLLKLGIRVIHGRPYHPQGRGKIERFHRTLKAEVFEARPYAGLSLARLQRRFDDWRTIYNMDRPHEALGMDVPASRYHPSSRPFPDHLPEVQYDSIDIVRRVSSTKAYVSFKGRPWKVSRAFRGERLAIRPTAKDSQYGIFFGATQIGSIDLNT